MTGEYEVVAVSTERVAVHSHYHELRSGLRRKRELFAALYRTRIRDLEQVRVIGKGRTCVGLVLARLRIDQQCRHRLQVVVGDAHALLVLAAVDLLQELERAIVLHPEKGNLDV